MTLIKCSACGRNVSDKATMCPNCARPLAPTPYAQRGVQVIELTAKRWKAVRMLGWILVLVAGLVLFTQWAAGDSRGVAAGWWIGLAGVTCLGISRAGAWWYHG